jgi:hypothetical protein
VLAGYHNGYIIISASFYLQVQGMAFLAAVLLLNMEEIDAFICFANLINRPMQMAFFSVDQPMVIHLQ